MYKVHAPAKRLSAYRGKAVFLWKRKENRKVAAVKWPSLNSSSVFSSVFAYCAHEQHAFVEHTTKKGQLVREVNVLQGSSAASEMRVRRRDPLNYS